MSVVSGREGACNVCQVYHSEVRPKPRRHGCTVYLVYGVIEFFTDPHFYHPRMFSVVSVCPSVYLSVCLSICPSFHLSVQTITFEPLYIGILFLVWRYSLTISRSSLSIKVIGSRSRSCAKNDYLLISTCYSFVCTYRPLIRSRSHIKVKVTHQGQGQIKVNIKMRSFLRKDTLTRVVCI